MKNYEDEDLKLDLENYFKEIIPQKDVEIFYFKDKKKFLEQFSPWHQDKGGNLINDFIKQVETSNTTEDFSWLKILPDDLKKEIEKEGRHLNMRYQIPTHFHGDIDTATIFHCLENPRGYLGDYQDNQIDKGLEETSLKGYYGKTEILIADTEKKKTIKTIKKILKGYKEKEVDIKSIIERRYKLKSIKDVKDIIYSNQSNLMSEIKHMFELESKFDFKNKSKKSQKNLLENYYYLREYYSQLIQKNKVLDFIELEGKQKEIEKIAQQICNLEIYPFSCAQPDLGENGIGEKIILNSDLSKLAAFIVLRRIYKYLNNKKSQKPVFVFRKYDAAWEKLFRKLFKEAQDEDFANKVMEKLENNFFYCQLRPIGGGITDGNVISVPNYRKFMDMKESAFDEITKLLPRIDVKIIEKDSL
ncbi:MAG: hypothetical protein E6Z64_04005 [Streptococcus parasanguinis]|jgi:hypothetical protein|uniref:hypothetical protein n=1 Tax=Streptococcus parasanguinis TaxID=1318 RepID=UPI00189BB920|nr:hypothetical protein [Streptococcus parasanguinis]MDU5706993.1 hypothetical protein [Streptococcus parasanguinis]MDU5844773.1 hypothetical protein [Streptococcus parasanguinis]